jgi:hypothetical protein
VRTIGVFGSDGGGAAAGVAGLSAIIRLLLVV